MSHVRQYAFDDLERHHDYIQWLFPLPEASGANAHAPLLTQEDISAFTSDEALQKALLGSFQLMLQFYGLDLSERGPEITITRGAEFASRRRVWLTRGNHNFLRISRILRSLTLLGLGSYALAFLKSLEEIYGEEATSIGDTTIEYWRRAVK